tara:strand:- start:586 stop:864 length:279 start_codon:yes stop_codon:yes gene_type:complete
MKLQSLRIALKQPYSDPSPTNPYQATLEVSYDDTKMQVVLGDETCRRLLELAGDEIAAAAQVQIQDFVRSALAVARPKAIEAFDWVHVDSLT